MRKNASLSLCLFVKICQFTLSIPRTNFQNSHIINQQLFPERVFFLIDTSCYIRFFHAASDTETLQVSVGTSVSVPELVYRTVTDYMPAGFGFLTITLSGTRTKRVYLQKTLPFFLPIRYTIAVIQTVNGLDLRQKTPDVSGPPIWLMEAAGSTSFFTAASSCLPMWDSRK